jgi:hypothetical protein
MSLQAAGSAFLGRCSAGLALVLAARGSAPAWDPAARPREARTCCRKAGSASCAAASSSLRAACWWMPFPGMQQKGWRASAVQWLLTCHCTAPEPSARPPGSPVGTPSGSPAPVQGRHCTQGQVTSSNVSVHIGAPCLPRPLPILVLQQHPALEVDLYGMWYLSGLPSTAIRKAAKVWSWPWTHVQMATCSPYSG